MRASPGALSKPFRKAHDGDGLPQALPGDGVQQERDTGDDLAVMIRVADRHAELLPVPYFHVVFTGTLSG